MRNICVLVMVGPEWHIDTCQSGTANTTHMLHTFRLALRRVEVALVD